MAGPPTTVLILSIGLFYFKPNLTVKGTLEVLLFIPDHLANLASGVKRVWLTDWMKCRSVTLFCCC